VNVTNTAILRDPQSNNTIDGGTVKGMYCNMSSGWMELEISELLQNLWSSKSPSEDAQIELTVNIKGSCEGQRRVPLHVINSAAKETSKAPEATATPGDTQRNEPESSHRESQYYGNAYWRDRAKHISLVRKSLAVSSITSV